MDAERPGRYFQLGGRVVQVKKREIRMRTQTQYDGADIQFRPPALFGPDAVSRRERTVHFGRYPVVHARRLKGHSAFHVTNPRGPVRRVVFIGPKCHSGNQRPRHQ